MGMRKRGKVIKNSIDGKFASKAEATAHPESTYVQTFGPDKFSELKAAVDKLMPTLEDTVEFRGENSQAYKDFVALRELLKD
jgi:hypothetical protein